MNHIGWLRHIPSGDCRPPQWIIQQIWPDIALPGHGCGYFKMWLDLGNLSRFCQPSLMPTLKSRVTDNWLIAASWGMADDSLLQDFVSYLTQCRSGTQWNWQMKRLRSTIRCFSNNCSFYCPVASVCVYIIASRCHRISLDGTSLSSKVPVYNLRKLPMDQLSHQSVPVLCVKTSSTACCTRTFIDICQSVYLYCRLPFFTRATLC